MIITTKKAAFACIVSFVYNYKEGEKNIAIRISEYEGMDTARNMAGLVSWIWLDCFTRIPINFEEY